MGQEVRQRGTFEERKAQAIAAGRIKKPSAKAWGWKWVKDKSGKYKRVRVEDILNG